MAIVYKQLCYLCKKNYATVTSKQSYVLCYECQKKEMNGEIKDPKMKKLFALPDQYYEKNYFLRNIKICYIKYGSLTEKQIEAFKKTVKNIKEHENK